MRGTLPGLGALAAGLALAAQATGNHPAGRYAEGQVCFGNRSGYEYIPEEKPSVLCEGPLKDAVIVLRNAEERRVEARTDENGRYRLPLLDVHGAVGDVIRVYKPGYGGQTIAGIGPDREAKPGYKLVLTLKPAQRIVFEKVTGKQLVAQAVEQAERFRDATLQGDYERVVDRMNPTIVERLGGYHNSIKTLAEQGQQMKRAGVQILSYEVRPPRKVYEADWQYVAFVPTTITMRINEREVRDHGFLIGSRGREGGPWFFVDGAGFGDRKSLMQLFPRLPSNFRFPEVKRETVTP